MFEIPVYGGKKAKVSEIDVELLSRHSWWMSGRYAATTIRIDGKEKNVFMHRMVVGDIPKEMCVDHINGESLDNTRANLRVATRSQNSANRKLAKSNSGKLGVYRARGKWKAQLQHLNVNVVIGHFDTLEEAVLARTEVGNVIYKFDVSDINKPSVQKFIEIVKQRRDRENKILEYLGAL